MTKHRIALVHLVYSNAFESGDQVVGTHWHPRALADELFRRGHLVTWFQGAPENFRYERLGYPIICIEFPRNGVQKFKRICRLFAIEKTNTASQEALKAEINRFAPDHIHFIGISPWRLFLPLANWCIENAVKYSISDHGGIKPRHPISRFRQAKFLDDAQSVFFPSTARAEYWRQSTNGHMLPEISSEFVLKSRYRLSAGNEQAADPTFIWAARLDPNKDPMTALQVFELINSAWPGSRLRMAFRGGELTNDVLLYVNARSQLINSVELLGEIPRMEMENFYNSGHIFIQTSKKEIGSNSLVEAMACGLHPVVTALPSLRFLTGNGKVGDLCEPGVPGDFAAKILARPKEYYLSAAKSIRTYFEKSLSYPWLVDQYERIWFGKG